MLLDGCSSRHFSFSCPVNASQRPLVELLVEPVVAEPAEEELPLAPTLGSDGAGPPDALSEVPVVAFPVMPAP
ncbi:MAG TPA: hypothetical protein VJT77_00055 [Burkholderiales bacterium]|nr:hypothetical protein [Burkholderiales bacterium]